MNTTAKSFLRLVLVAGGTIAKSCLLPQAAADSLPSRSGLRRTTIAFLAKSRTRSTHGSLWQPSFSLVLAALSDPLRFQQRSTEHDGIWAVLFKCSSLYCWTLAVEFYWPIGRRLAFAPGHASSCTLTMADFLWRQRRLGEGPFELGMMMIWDDFVNGGPVRTWPTGRSAGRSRADRSAINEN